MFFRIETVPVAGDNQHVVFNCSPNWVTAPDSDKFCHPQIIFANSLDPDQARHNDGPDLDPSFLTLILFTKAYSSLAGPVTQFGEQLMFFLIKTVHVTGANQHVVFNAHRIG